MKQIKLLTTVLIIPFLAIIFFNKKETKDPKQEIKAKFKPFTRYNNQENIAGILLKNYAYEQQLSATQTDIADWKPIADKYFRVAKHELAEITPHKNEIIAGRMMDVAFHPTNKDILFAASDTGGVWKTTDHGVTWNCISNNSPIVGVSTIMVDPNDTNKIIVGTDNPALGIFITKDGGTTWQKAPQLNNDDGKFKRINHFIRSKTNSNHILSITTNTNLNNIYKSTDGGDTWTYFNPSGIGFKHVLINPKSNTLYGISVDSFDGINLKKSYNFGQTWVNTNITHKFMKDGVEQQAQSARLAMSKSDTTSLFINFTGTEENLGTLLEKNNVITPKYQGSTSYEFSYNDPDSGGPITVSISDVIGDQYDSFFTFVANPNNTNNFFLAGTDVSKSDDGMATVAKKVSTLTKYPENKLLPQTYVHVDITNMAFSPITNDLYITCDGGISISKDNGATFQSLSGSTKGLNTIQIYDFVQSATNANIILTGNQDNGTLGFSKTDEAFYQYAGGDIFFCDMSPKNDKLYAISSLGGETTIHRVGTGDNNYDIKNTTVKFNINTESHPTEPAGDELAIGIPLFDHTTENRLFFGMYNVFRYDNLQNTSVNPTKKLTNISGKGMVISLHQSIVDANMLYFGTKNNHFYRVENSLGNTPNVIDLSTKLPSISEGSRGPTSIITDPANSNIVYIAYRNKFYKSTDKGDTWVDYSNGLPNNIFTRQAVLDTSDSSTFKDIYVSTDTGVYVNTDGTGFKPFKKGIAFSFAPTKMKIFYTTPGTGKMRMSTYGRGMWESPLASNQTLSTLQNEFNNDNNITVFPNPAINEVNISRNRNTKAHIRMFDLNGKLVKEKVTTTKTTKLGVSQLSKGVYFIQVTEANNSKVNSFKMVKK